MKAFALIAFLIAPPAFAELSCDLELQESHRVARQINVVKSEDVSTAEVSKLPETDLRALIVVDRELEDDQEQVSLYLKRVGQATVTKASTRQSVFTEHFSFGSTAPSVGGDFTVHCQR